MFHTEWTLFDWTEVQFKRRDFRYQINITRQNPNFTCCSQFTSFFSFVGNILRLTIIHFSDFCEVKSTWAVHLAKFSVRLGLKLNQLICFYRKLYNCIKLEAICRSSLPLKRLSHFYPVLRMHRSNNASNYQNRMAIWTFRLSRYPSSQSCAYVLSKLYTKKVIHLIKFEKTI